MKLKFFRNFLLLVIGLKIPHLSFAAEAKLIEVDNQKEKDDYSAKLNASQSLARFLTKKDIQTRSTIFNEYQIEVTYEQAFKKITADDRSLLPIEAKDKLDQAVQYLLERKLITIEENKILSTSPSRGGGSGTG